MYIDIDKMYNKGALDSSVILSYLKRLCCMPSYNVLVENVVVFCYLCYPHAIYVLYQTIFMRKVGFFMGVCTTVHM